jgi:DUF3043 family protein
VFLRRRTATAPDAGPDDAAGGTGDSGAPEPAQAGPAAARGHAVTAGKGRPTPKRSQAQRRRQPFTAPKDRKEASRQYRDRDRQARTRRLEAMRRGEEWAFPPRDRGPVKALARDYVDSRRRVSEYYMYGLVVLMVLLFVRNPLIQTIIPLAVVGAVLIMLTEGLLIGRQVRRLAEQRLPGENTRGVRIYAAMRALQIRQLRMPKPRIRPGSAF